MSFKVLRNKVDQKLIRKTSKKLSMTDLIIPFGEKTLYDRPHNPFDGLHNLLQTS